MKILLVLWMSTVAVIAELPSVICFGSCGDQNKPQPILDTVIADKPDLFIYLGDNIYSDTDKAEVIEANYRKLGEKREFQRLKASTQLLAIWDDHDYGWNDAGKSYALKRESEKLFLDFWEVPENHDRRKHPGIYGEYRFSEEGRTVQVLLLDTRYFRDDLRNNPDTVAPGSPFKNDYQPDPSPEKSFLGTEQWRWLEACLNKPADLRIIASSIQFGHEYNGWESWTNLPHEHQKMMHLLRKTRANGVIFISGDVHWGEISKRQLAPNYPLYDVTSSGLNREWPTVEPNRFRVGKVYRKHNYGRIRINWRFQRPQVVLAVVGIDGQAKSEVSFELDSLSF